MRTDAGLALVGDHAGARGSLVELLAGLSLVPAFAETGAGVLAAAEARPCALIVLAVDLPEPSGFEVLYRLRERFGTGLPIVALGAVAGAVARDEIAALLLGADDYFEVPVSADRFCARVRRLIHPRARTAPSVPNRAPLTRREHEVLALLSHGLQRTEIAEHLCITGKTVATHIERILGKLDAHSQAQAVAFALRDGIVSAGSRATPAPHARAFGGARG